MCVCTWHVCVRSEQAGWSRLAVSPVLAAETFHYVTWRPLMTHTLLFSYALNGDTHAAWLLKQL